MRRKKQYALAFLAVMVAAAIGAYASRRLVRSVEVPTFSGLPSVGDALAEINVNALLPRRRAQPGPVASATPAARLTATALPSASSDTPLAALLGTSTPTPEPALTEATATPTIEPIPTSPPSATLASAYAYLPAAAVRHSSEGCPGASIRGVVLDIAGGPLAGVRLWRYDQYGNEQVVETKSADVDRGQYDFTLGDTPNTHYVQIIDAGGSIISPVVEVTHRQGEAGDAACHWIDWIQQ